MNYILVFMICFLCQFAQAQNLCDEVKKSAVRSSTINDFILKVQTRVGVGAYQGYFKIAVDNNEFIYRFYGEHRNFFGPISRYVIQAQVDKQGYIQVIWPAKMIDSPVENKEITTGYQSAMSHWKKGFESNMLNTDKQIRKEGYEKYYVDTPCKD